MLPFLAVSSFRSRKHGAAKCGFGLWLLRGAWPLSSSRLRWLGLPWQSPICARFARSGPSRSRRRLSPPSAVNVAAEFANATSFSQLPLSDAVQHSIKDVFQYTDLSEVQRQVLPVALAQTRDLVVRAHTGTGKTLAFLIPAMEVLLASPNRRSVGALVVAPTRELALQIGREAELLLSPQGIKVVVLIGGSSMREDQLKLRRSKARVMVATPGRLLEHLERTYLFSTLFEHLDTLVLDEADRLLSLGFLNDVKEIVSYLPAKRRTMLFSATVAEDVLDVAAGTCRGNYSYIDCIGEGESETAGMVDQTYVVLPGHQCMNALYNLIMHEMARDKFTYKILVFFPTARLTSFMADFFRKQLKVSVTDIHRRLNAEDRLAAQQHFHGGRCGILFSSDVSARGMDYPNVSLVVQFCAPSTREMYIHRVGRTARAGKEGQAVLLLGELEQEFMRCVTDLPVRPHPDTDSLRRVNELLVKATTTWLTSTSLRSSATAAFASLLVHYKSTHRVLRMVDDDVVQAASDLLLGCGLVDQPVVSKRLAILLGLEHHPQLQCAARLGEEDPVAVAEATGGLSRSPAPRFGAGVLARPRAGTDAEVSCSPASSKRSRRWQDE